MQCPTIKIQDGSDYIVINESDFDEKTQKLFIEKADKKAESSKKKADKKAD